MGFAESLATELVGLGATETRVRRSGVNFVGSLETAYAACLWSRLAGRVMLPIATFEAKTPEALYSGVRNILWREHLDVDSSFAIDCTLVRSVLRHSKHAALVAKDGIVDQFRESLGKRPNVQREQPNVRIHLHVEKNQATVSIDLSGDSLHRREYRTDTGPAPLKENLAAGLLVKAGWPNIASANGGFIDPMCGSGTLAVEAALIALDRAPGLTRSYFGFLGWEQHDNALWQSQLAHAKERAELCSSRARPRLVGFDQDGAAIKRARGHAAKAGVGQWIHFERRALSQSIKPLQDHAIAPPRAGLLITNPPYGERLHASESTERELGAVLQHCPPAWRLALLTTSDSISARIGLQVKAKHRCFNGPIECDLLEFQANASQNEVSKAPAAVQDSSFANRLRKNLRSLRKWARREEVRCYRIYDADIPEYAVAVDLYQGLETASNEQSWAHVQEYAAPANISPVVAARRLDTAVDAVSQVLELPSNQIYLKRRVRGKGGERYGQLKTQASFEHVREGRCEFLVNFTDHVDTGLFLDHRNTRQFLSDAAHEKSFLNLFAYTGTATVHAALGGARRSLSVDMSPTYARWAKQNFTLNGLDPMQHRYETIDCFAWLKKRAVRESSRFDLIFLDPPTFSNSKRMQTNFDVQRDHSELIVQVLSLLRPNGTLFFSTNARKFRLDATLAEPSERISVEDISAQTVPFDFSRRSNIHRCWRFTHHAVQDT